MDEKWRNDESVESARWARAESKRIKDMYLQIHNAALNEHNSGLISEDELNTILHAFNQHLPGGYGSIGIEARDIASARIGLRIMTDEFVRLCPQCKDVVVSASALK